ncbi:hypothetical protein B0I33_101109 [Prauserella shujinwangii]|uniref:Uncharacterized protein n=1 Tax=Prauserella shujinwangii TaxID=1453103 RepID=A0A2T0M2J4_9PSEU|nr:hypothetical protein [Prauserella shujinwangii]PRX50957.1 hypothetical protein B0I33_101109 [Prauserella shujinwangii]
MTGDGEWRADTPQPAGEPERSGAEGPTTVGQQNEINYGETTIHLSNHYSYRDDDPPERKFEIALHFLCGGSPRMAERILDEVSRSGYGPTRFRYYHALAVLGGRSLNEIDDVVAEKVDYATRIPDGTEEDEWTASALVIRRIVGAAWYQDGAATRDPALANEILGRIGTLPPERRTELHRHLDMLLSGVTENDLGTDRLRALDSERRRNSRAYRAWKFFEPDPAAPRRRRTEPYRPGWPEVPHTASGLVLLVAGVLAGGWAATGARNPALLLLTVLALLAGIATATRYDTVLRTRAMTLRRKEKEHQGAAADLPAQPGHWVTSEFTTRVARLVEDEFARAAPPSDPNWERTTSGIRKRLAFIVADLYGNSRVEPGQLRWLVRFHARGTREALQDGSLRSHRADLAPPLRERVGVAAGRCLAVAAAVTMVPMGGAVAAPLLLIGGVLGAHSLASIVAARQDGIAAQAEADAVLRDEQAEYDRWRGVLADRPSDDEMGEWLDRDKTYVLAAAVRDCGLAYRDLLSHVVLTQASGGANRARVSGGPLRYSSYHVIVFLLTKNGVRQVRFRLDFLHATLWSQERTAFRYQVLVAATISRSGNRYQPAHAATADHLVAKAPSLGLRFVDGTSLTIRPDTAREDPAGSPWNAPDTAEELALENSGITAALRILETVAAEGGDWTAREQQRRQRRMRRWLSDSAGDSTRPRRTRPPGAEGVHPLPVRVGAPDDAPPS